MTSHEHDRDVPRDSSRRDFLRRSAVATGAVWAAPTILSVGPRALARGTAVGLERLCAQGLGTLYRFKWEADPGGQVYEEPFQPGIFVPAEDNVGQGSCDKPTGYDEAIPLQGGGAVEYRFTDDGLLMGVTASVDDDGTVTFTLPEGCELRGYSAKGGSINRDGDDACNEVTDLDPNGPSSFTVTTPPNGAAVSNVLAVFCCDELAV